MVHIYNSSFFVSYFGQREVILVERGEVLIPQGLRIQTRKRGVGFLASLKKKDFLVSGTQVQFIT